MKRFLQFSILYLLLLLISGVVAMGATLNVPGTYATIQAAVNAAVNGDIIVVAAGTYTENITINTDLTINGPNVGITGNGARGAEAIISDGKVSIMGSNTVILDGFKIYQTNTTTPISLGGSAVATIQNNIIERFGATTGSTLRGIETSAGAGVKNISNNLFTGDVSGGLYSGHKTWNSGMYINAAGSTLNITGNVFQNCRTAINIDDMSAGVTLSSNTFSNCGTYISFGGVTPTTGSYTFGANEFNTAVGTVLNLSNVATTFRLDVSAGTYGGVSFSSLPLNTMYEIELRTYHRGRYSRNGLVTYVPNNLHVVNYTGTGGPIIDNINTAISYASSGNIINLQNGTFTENININKKVNIIGSGSGPSGTILKKVTGSDYKEGIIQLNASGTSTSDPILLKDLRLEPIGFSGISVGRFTEATGTNVSFIKLDNIAVIGTGTNPCTEQERGLYVDNTSSLTNLVISNCKFNNLTYGWYIQKQVSADASTVSNVMVDNTEFVDNLLKGLYAEKLEDATFDNCLVNHNGYMDISALSCNGNFGAWKSGFDINLKAGTYQNLTFQKCVITNNGLNQAKEGTGLAIKGRDDGATYGPFPAVVSDVFIDCCEIIGNERGLRFGEPGKNNNGPTNVNINNTKIYNNNKTYVPNDGTAYGDLVNQCKGNVNAENNWWGQASGPAAGKIVDASSGITDYTPFLTAPVNCNCTDAVVDDDWSGKTNGDIVYWNSSAWIYGTNAFSTIQAGIDAVCGSTVNVLPGNYSETASGRTLSYMPGTYQFGLFINKDNLTLRGVTETGSIITDYNLVQASVKTNASNNFGTSGIFVDADNFTITGLEILDNYNPPSTLANNKTFEVVGDGFTMKYCKMSVNAAGTNNAGAVYINDELFNTVTMQSNIKSYTIENNLFDWGNVVSIANGAGYSGTLAQKNIRNNFFDGKGRITSLIGFSGDCRPSVAWYRNPVGGATIEGNTFKDFYWAIRERGISDETSFLWDDYWTKNTYDKAVVATNSISPVDPVEFSYGTSPYIFSSCKRIGSKIQEEIDIATTNSYVLVKKGTYVEDIDIAKSITVQGEDKALCILNPASNTAVGGNVATEGWWYIAPSFTVGIKNFTFDGTGKQVNHAIQSRGSLNMDNCDIKNVKYGTYNGRGIVLYGGSSTIKNVNISNIERIGIHIRGSVETPGPYAIIENLNYTGKGAGVWLDYGVEFGAGGKGIVRSSKITNCTGVADDLSTSAGILVTDYYGGGTEAEIYHCVLTGNSDGIAHGYQNGDISVLKANYNSIYNNDSYGIYTTNYTLSLNAEFNWWGDCSGPSDDADLSPTSCTSTALGSGDRVSCGVDFTPWLGGGSFYSPALWLTPTTVIGNPSIETWPGIDCGTGLDATMDPPNANRQPSYVNNGVRFVSDYGDTKYGYSDMMEVVWDKDVTTNNPDKWNPSNGPKNLFVAFKTGSSVDDADHDTYYRDGRQTICEFGGPLSGYGIYMINSKLAFGMWNRFESKFLVYDPPSSSIYPLDPNKIYLAQLEYEAGSFTARLSDGTTSPSSAAIAFAGISQDGATGSEDKSGIGGATRTRYHDYSTGETYSDEFDGILGDVIVYNDDLDATENGNVVSYLTARYIGGTMGNPKRSDDDWKVYQQYDFTGDNAVSTAYPNPFSATTSFGVNLTSDMNVTIELIDATGVSVQSIYRGQLNKGIHDFTINGENLPNGMYFYRLQGDGFSLMGKAVLNK